MSSCIFIASDSSLPEFAPLKEYHVTIDVDKGIVFDGRADDYYFLREFAEASFYSGKRHGVSLEWDYTDGRAKQIINYIKNALKEIQSVELWKVWLTEYYEFEDRPLIHRKEISVDELTKEHIREIDNGKIWDHRDKTYPERPSFYCLKINR